MCLLNNLLKMSSCYNQHEINKKILKKYVKPRSETDVLGPYNKYRDEYLQTYEEKKRRFIKLVKKFSDYNRKLLACCKCDEYNVTDDFCKELEIKETDEEEFLDNCCNNPSKLLLRKRFEKSINYQIKYEKNNLCTLEPWLKRFLILSRFIYVARCVIIKNRLLKNLEILKKLNNDTVQTYETEKKYDNVSYSELFVNFIG